MMRVLAAGLGIALLCAWLTTSADATFRRKQWSAEVTTKQRKSAVMDERDLHCHNTRRVGLKCHRGLVYNGPR